MTRQRKIDKPFNFGYTMMDNEFPEDLHYNLNVPGIYVRKANKQVYFKDGRIGEMDTSYIVDPDYKIIFVPMVVNGEHQSTPLGDNKIRMMNNYRIQQIHDENLTQLGFVASKIPKEKHKQQYKASPSDTFEPLFLDLGEEDNTKRLNKIKKIINNNEISNRDALNLGIISLFAPEGLEQQRTREVVELYSSITDKISNRMEFTLYSVLNAMIDAYFDDETEYREMISMLQSNTSQKSMEEFESLNIAKNTISILKKANADAFNRIDNLERDNADARDEISNLKRDKADAFNRIDNLERDNADARDEISNLERDNADARDEISNLKRDKADADDEISKLKLEIEDLKAQLNKNNK